MKRWYEMSADVCILISMLELAQNQDRERYAKKLIKELVSNGYEPDVDLYEKCKNLYPMGRWYDQDKDLFLAIEYLKDAPTELQQEAILKVSDYMRLRTVV